MGFIVSALKSIWKVVSGPTDILSDWAEEPLKRWQNAREQKNKDNDLRREIESQIAVKRFESDKRMEEETHHADLEIRMQTEINRINAETEEWQKDQQFKRWQKAVEAVAVYKERLTELNTNAIRAIAEMDIDLRTKAQDLIINKTKEYKALQDKAEKDAEDECERILAKFDGKDRIIDMLLKQVDNKLAGIVENSNKFISELNSDIMEMSRNINSLTSAGQKFIEDQLNGANQFKSLPNDEKYITDES